MNARRFFLAALLAAVIAVLLHVAALGQFSQGLAQRAQAASLGEPERAAAKALAEGCSVRGHVAMYAGLAFAFASAAFAIKSARRQEPARRAIVIGVLACYGLLHFVLI